jgi:hypothetical protein
LLKGIKGKKRDIMMRFKMFIESIKNLGQWSAKIGFSQINFLIEIVQIALATNQVKNLL